MENFVPSQKMNVLISYSHVDASFVQSLKRKLEKYNLTVFMDKHDMQYGEEIARRVSQAIVTCDFVLLIISPASLQSGWVNWEIEETLKQEQIEGRMKILPILIRGSFIPSQIAGRNWADFRTPYLQKKNFKKIIGQLLKSIPAFPSLRKDKNRVDMQKINEDFFSSENMLTIKSPMIGAIYERPSPGKPKFINVGDKITAGQVICIIEAMKLFNEIESEYSGTVREILFDDGQPVEYDQPLVLLEPVQEE